MRVAVSVDGFWNYVWSTIIIWALNLVLDNLRSNIVSWQTTGYE